MYLNILINSERKKFDVFYKKLLKNSLSNDLLSKAMIYGSINGGKRIRPFLVSIFSTISGSEKKQAKRVSAAIESIHSYSLIHDDLPSMDNDDFRRGKLSTHKKFNEATAILAGDALHDLAFEILSDKKTHNDASVRIDLVNKLSKYLGFNGLAGGQSLDLLFENKKINMHQILNMYQKKTSALFSFSCMAPFILAKKSNKDVKFAEDFGKVFGLIFQITDDILDEEQDFKMLGKTPGKDKQQGKSTLLSIKKKVKLKKFCLDEIKKIEKNNKKMFESNMILKQILSYNINKLS